MILFQVHKIVTTPISFSNKKGKIHSVIYTRKSPYITVKTGPKEIIFDNTEELLSWAVKESGAKLNETWILEVYTHKGTYLTHNKVRSRQ